MVAVIAGVCLAAVAGFIALSLATRGGGSSERLLAISVPGRSQGQEDAPVTILEVSDYQCPACKTFADTTEKEIENEYVETGRVRLEFRNMAFIGQESVLAAEAAECANEQGRFWDYHDKLFAEQTGENVGSFIPERLKQFASDLELDREAFDRCLDSQKHLALILEEREAADEAGVKSTPSFFVNGELVQGALEFEDFQPIVERALDKAQEEGS